MDPDRLRISEVMSINRPSRRRDDVRWPRSAGTVVPQGAVPGPLAVDVVGSGGSVTASSPPGEVTVTQLVVTVPLDDSVAGTGGTS